MNTTIMDNSSLFKMRERVFEVLEIYLDREKNIGIATFDSALVNVLELFINRYEFSSYDTEEIMNYCEFQYNRKHGIKAEL